MKTKKGQYFTIDAFIASVIVAVSLLIALTARTAQPYTTQAELTAKGFADSLSQAKLWELNNPLITNLTNDGVITNLDNSVIQQVAEFYVLDQKDQAFELLSNVTFMLIPAQYNFEVIVDDQMIYNRTSINENQSKVIVSSQKLVFGVIGRSVQPYGPLLAEVRVWQ